MMTTLILVLAGSFLFSATTVTAQEEPTIDVEKLAENVYLYTHNSHRSLFVVSGEQILVTDPQSPEAAKRYLAEVRKISQAPIRYMVYSHHHGDHVSGGAAFGDGPIVIGHANVPGYLSGDSAAEIVPLDITFSDQMSIQLDDLEVRLIYPGPSETDSSVIVFVPERKVAFMVDAVASRRLPFRTLGDSNLSDWVAALEELDTLDFEILAPGHGPTGTKANVREYIQYFTDLTEAVRKGIEQGQSLEEIQESLELLAYTDWLRYDGHFKLNIEGVYGRLMAESD